ncbi:MAG: hypothetical protein ACLQF0_06675 [Dissulfurispiraceae bacterium]
MVYGRYCIEVVSAFGSDFHSDYDTEVERLGTERFSKGFGVPVQ